MNTPRYQALRGRGALAAALIALTLAMAPASVTLAQTAPGTGCLAWTPEGTGLIYCGDSTSGGIELYERDEEGGVRQLTFLGGTVLSADVSAGGGLVTFHATLPTDPTPQVYMVSRYGPRARSVLVGGSVIEIGTRRVLVGSAVIDIEGVRARRLTGDGANLDPAFTPNGSRIGFTSDRTGLSSLWSMNIDGSDQRELLVARAD